MTANSKTPIEILLRIEDDNTVRVSNVYEFLELHPAAFARWCKTNILENDFVEENVDFSRLNIDVETPTGGKFERTDYKLSIPFAKKLCMRERNERGEQARNYFIAVEELAKRQIETLTVITPERINAILKIVNLAIRSAEKQGHTSRDVALMLEYYYKLFNLPLPVNFIKRSHIVQLSKTYELLND